MRALNLLYVLIIQTYILRILLILLTFTRTIKSFPERNLFILRVVRDPGDFLLGQRDSSAIKPGHSAESLLDIVCSNFCHEEARRLGNEECQDSCEDADSAAESGDVPCVIADKPVKKHIAGNGSADA